jgi:hypothetical protein
VAKLFGDRQWRAAADALRADPQAVVQIETEQRQRD